jgi:hypothetical protein
MKQAKKKPDTEKRRDPHEVLGARPDPEGIEIVQKGLIGSGGEKLLRALKDAAGKAQSED